MSPAERLLRELIALPSVNPALMPPNDARAGEERVAKFLTHIADRGGLEVERREVFPHRHNILARYRPKGARQRVILAPHMDTVGHVSMSDSLFVAKKEGGRLYGRGACDTKGSVAAMLTAMLNVAGNKQRPCETEIVVAALLDEE